MCVGGGGLQLEAVRPGSMCGLGRRGGGDLRESRLVLSARAPSNNTHGAVLCACIWPVVWRHVAMVVDMATTRAA